MARKYNNEISPEELSELSRLLQQPGDAHHLNELLADLQAIPLRKITTDDDEAKSIDALRLLLSNDGPGEESRSIQEFAGTNRRKARFYAAWTAASLVITACAWFMLHNSRPPAPVVTPVNEVVTNGGSKSTVHLPDGSSVILNTGSKLSYNKDFGAVTREIYLSGEAFFDIAKNEKMPLVVHAGNVDILVKGTIFNVKAYTEDSTVEASLIRGVIEVFSKDDRERKIMLKKKKKIIIGKTSTVSSSEETKRMVKPPKEAVFFLGKIKPNPVDSSISEIAWIQNKLAFYKEPFSSLAQKMERWYNVSIQFNDERLKKFTFTGSFEKEDIIEALNALREIAAFEYTIENRNVIIGKAESRQG